MDIGHWLRGLGLQSYEQVFRDNAIDLEVLPHLTADDLKDMGIVAVGHRRKILDAIGHLAAGPADDRSAPAPPAERRQLTVMFVDLVGSTDLSRRLDPEELREVMRAYQNAVAAEIARFDGHIAKFLGDGVLAYFGWPRASEDSAERAVHAGLAIVTAVAAMPATAGRSMAARVGIATGIVVVGDFIGEGAALEEAVTGETPNLAARLQVVAEPGSVVIADSTRRLVGDLFGLTPLGPHALKGFAEPVPAWRAIGEGRAESRFAALHGAHLTPIVGRGEELDLGLARWRQAKEGDGQVLLITGEPGIGKSRLMLALRDRLDGEPVAVITYACSPHHLSSALFPFIAQIERAARFAPDDTWETRLGRLEALLCEQEETPDDQIALFADLLGIPAGTGYALAEMSSLQRKVLLFRAFLTRLEGLAARGPLLIVLEDAHWLDPTSHELFDQIVERLQRLPVLMVATLRPELPPPWAGFPHVTLIKLSRLTQSQSQSLVERVTEGKSLPAEVLEQIVARTEGVPLFTEELTKAVLESGLLHAAGDRYLLDGPLQPFAIPATLQDSLMARLDRLAPVKEVAQIGACIGREFDHELLAAVVPLSEAELAAALDRLVAAELVFRRSVPPATLYVFKHALVRDAAYESLLRRRRQELHARIAAAMETRFPQIADARPELVAHHFREAGVAAKAVQYWLEAGRLAAARSANVEAIAHLRSGLDSARELPPGESRSRSELSLQLALGASLLLTKGFASREAGASFERARELSRGPGREAELFTALRGLGFVQHVRGNLRDATRLVDEAVALAEKSGDPVLIAEACHFAGAVAFHLAKFKDARDWSERCLHADEGRRHFGVYGISMGVFSRAYISHCDWHLGFADRALGIAEEGLTLAREISHPFSIALALNYLAMLRQFRREPEAAGRAADEAHAICVEYRFDYYGAWSNLMRAWAIGEAGRLDESLAAYDAALSEFRRTGAGIRLPHYLGRLAALNRKAGRVAAGLRLVAEGAAAAEENGETWSDAELERERGELLLVSASKDAERQAEDAFRAAIERAAAQGAKPLELRARVAQARLLGACGKREDAREVLAPLIGWFTEGSGTPDLVEANAVLTDLR